VCVAFGAAGSFNACLASFVTFGPLEADCYLSWHLVLLVVNDTSLTRGARGDALGLHVAMQPGCNRATGLDSVQERQLSVPSGGTSITALPWLGSN
jgi:hypothetical protein